MAMPIETVAERVSPISPTVTCWRPIVCANPLGQRERILELGIRQEHHELLASEACGDVVRPQAVAEDVGDALEDGIAGEVAVGVVDLSQQVEVDHQQRERLPRSQRCSSLSFSTVLK